MSYFKRLEKRVLFDASVVGALMHPQDSHATTTSDAPVAVVEAVAPADGGARVLVISSDVAQAEELAKSAAPGVIVVSYDSRTTLTALFQSIKASLGGVEAVSIAFATHGAAGELDLTASVIVTEATLRDTPQLQAFWHDVGQLISSGGRIDLLACDTGQDANLIHLIDNFADDAATGKTVVVDGSIDLTGNGKGANWLLETSGVDVSGLYFTSALSDWQGTLATFAVTNTADAGAGSLRAAITSANADSDPSSTINFGSTTGTISLGSALPTITHPVSMVSTPGAITLTESAVVNQGLFVAASNSTIQGLTITGFSAWGVVSTADHVLISGNVISGNATGGVLLSGPQAFNDNVFTNTIGLNADGTTVSANGIGVLIENGAHDNSISSGNIISGNTYGIVLNTTGGGNVINGDFIGTSASGLLDRGNTLDGIYVSPVNPAVTISNNVISGNDGNGIELFNSSNNIHDNTIGLSFNGSLSLGNGGWGIFLNGSDSNTINHNSIEFNGGGGVAIYGSGSHDNTLTSNTILSNTGDGVLILNGAHDNFLDGGSNHSTLNIISGNGANGVEVNNAGVGNHIYANYIGTNFAGDTAIGNTNDGILVVSSAPVGIDFNVISGNGANGIEVTGGGSNNIYRNSIGLASDGITPLGNSGWGVVLNDSANNGVTQDTISNNTLGGVDITGSAAASNVLQGNIITANTGVGVLIENSAHDNFLDGGSNHSTLNIISGNSIGVEVNNAGVGNHIYANFIGTDVTGFVAVPNTGDGILVVSSPSVNIEFNIISGNGTNGIELRSGDNRIYSNYIGLASDGTTPLSNSDFGIWVNNSADNTIISNTVTGNLTGGVYIAGTLATGNSLTGNTIGTNSNLYFGVLIEGGASSNTIGGDINVSTDRNVIYGNRIGVEVNSAGIGNVIQGNYIGIDATGTVALPNIFGVYILNSTGVTIGGGATHGNIISGNSSIGIVLDGSGSDNVLGNTIGLNAAGTAAVANGTGVLVQNGAHDNSISSGNIISGNVYGVVMVNVGSGNVIQGNFIGTDATGLLDKGNTSQGVRIDGGASVTVTGNVISNNDLDGIDIINATTGMIIGGSNVGDGNTVSGNGGWGIVLDDSSNNLIYSNTISNNTIGGVEVTGSAADHNSLQGNSISNNTGDGLFITNLATNTSIGGDVNNLTQRNVITGNVNGLEVNNAGIGNGMRGSYITGNTNDGVLITGSNAVVVGGWYATEQNLISGNGNNGIEVVNSNSDLIQSNWIGLNALGTAALPNVNYGVLLINSSGNDIYANFVSGNGNGGVFITGAASDSNILKGNIIGLATDGNTVVGNVNTAGIWIDPAVTNTLIGGADVLNAVVVHGRNIISGNTHGIVLNGVGLGTVIDGNSIGTDATGLVDKGNTGDGIYVGPASALVTIDNNVISNNHVNGIELFNSSNNIHDNTVDLNHDWGIFLNGSDSNSITTNSIEFNGGGGVALYGAGTHDNNLTSNSIYNNVGDGVLILNSAHDNTLNANNINANTSSGVEITGNSVTGNILTDNTIFSNTSDGVLIGNGAYTNTIGGNSTADRNVISSNGANGVEVNGAGIGNIIQGNYIGLASNGTDPLGNSDFGIVITSDHVQITDNLISHNTLGGVDLSGNGSHDNTLFINTIFNNVGDGVLIEGGAYTNTLNANNIEVNGGGGVEITGSGTYGNFLRNNGIYNNTGDGVLIENGTHDNFLDGGSNSSTRNIISGNGANGVEVNGAGVGNHIYANYIGTNFAGDTSVANTGGGILVVSSSSVGIDFNLISGNGTNGIEVTGGGSNNIYRNSIGLAADGITSLGNSGWGVVLNGSASNGITQNTISHNALGGVDITGSAAANNVLQGNTITANTGDGVLIENSAHDNFLDGGSNHSTLNIISGNSIGVEVNNAGVGNHIYANYIGTNFAGDTSVANTGDGILVVSSSSVGIDFNLISGNGANGIEVTGGGSNNIYRNSIGLAADGITPLGNSGWGVVLNDSASSGVTQDTISNNTLGGVEITGSAAASNVLQGNTITANTGVGVLIENSAHDNFLDGGSNHSTLNIISGNSIGVEVNNVGVGNHIYANFIGTDVTGLVAVPNIGDGILVVSSSSVGIDFNVISGNGANGIEVTGGGSNNIYRNSIGLASDGITPLGNSGWGVVLNDSASNGITQDTISNNILGGVEITGAAAASNVLQGNTITANTGVGVLIENSAHDNFLDGGSNHSTLNIISGNSIGVEVNNAGVGNHIYANFIGTGVTGLIAVPNTGDGILVVSSSPVNIEFNIISGNGTNGIELRSGDNRIYSNYIGLASDGTTPLSNSDFGIWVNNSANNQIIQNTVTGNLTGGVYIAGTLATGNSLTGNTIGMNGNVYFGVLIENGASSNTIGDDVTVSTDRNVIDGNRIGVEVNNAGICNVIQGNYIGIDATGTAALPNTYGVYILNSTGVTIGGDATHGNIISGNSSIGIVLDGSGGNSVLGNTIGLNAAGTAAVANDTGVLVQNGTHDNTIGSNNVISGNVYGVVMVNAGSGNVIHGNFIGTDATGLLDKGNTSQGVRIDGGASVTVTGNVISNNDLDGIAIINATTGMNIGGSNVGDGNTVSGNGGWGIILANSANNHIYSNTISHNTLGGVEVTGSAADHNSLQGNMISSNTGDGIFITNLATNTSIGGDVNNLTQRNVITGNVNGVEVNNAGIGNGMRGSYITGNTNDGVLITGSNGVVVGGWYATEQNLISGNGNNGIEVVNSNGDLIQSNWIGLNAAGTAALPNGNFGVLLINSSSNAIYANFISGNDNSGVFITGALSDGNLLKGNTIGLAVDGTTVLGNGTGNIAGIWIDPAVTNTLIGGADVPNAVVVHGRNIISGNTHGIVMNGVGLGTVIDGNSIGTAATGGNTGDGIYVGPASDPVIISNNMISSNHANGIELFNIGNLVEGNTLSLNGTAGVLIQASSTLNTIGLGNIITGNGIGIWIQGASDNTIVGNNIGTDGINDLGNAHEGILVDNGTSNVISDNIISGNDTYGVHIQGTLATGNTLDGNTIGLSSAGTALPNTLDGVFIDNAPGNTLGGTQRNFISGNGGNGVEISGAAAIGNVVENNFIGTNRFGNGAIGNQLNGVLITGGANNNVIGDANIISGNIMHGVSLMGGAYANTIIANYIGLDVTGSFAVPNLGDGIFIADSNSNVIVLNYIGGNHRYGLELLPNNSGNIVSFNVFGRSVDQPFHKIADLKGPLGGHDVGQRITGPNILYDIIFSGSPTSIPVISDPNFVGAWVVIVKPGISFEQDVNFEEFQQEGIQFISRDFLLEELFVTFNTLQTNPFGPTLYGIPLRSADVQRFILELVL